MTESSTTAKASPSVVKVLGIRHHGPGSARSVWRALNEMAPDIVLIEGPPEADKLIQYVGHAELIPPVALLIYAPDNLKQACYYPFAEFSPEWQAMDYANANQVPCRFIDLPQSHWFGLARQKKEPELNELLQAILPDNLPQMDEPTDGHLDDRTDEQKAESKAIAEAQEKRALEDKMIASDPIGALARAAGYSDGERWWEQIVEQRQTNDDVFEAISEAMNSLRQAVIESKANTEKPPADSGSDSNDDDEPSNIEELREAHMRQAIRQAQKEGFKKIAVVCGAWHAPAIDLKFKAKEDQLLLKGLPKAKVESTWIPWTHGRLQHATGYGAGINSPGWYEHIFKSQEGQNNTLSWLVKVASLLREQDLDASTAQVIDAVRLAEALAAMRDLNSPGLEEVTESTITCLLAGNVVPLALIEKKLLVGEKLGEVPADLPGTPLMVDFNKQVQRLRIKPEAGKKDLDLDLRKPLDLERSVFFARLLVLAVNWAEKQKVVNKKSTFHESWRLNWKPELSLALVEASIWGRSIEEGASQLALDKASNIESFAALVKLLALCLDANLGAAAKEIMQRVSNQAVVASDVGELMKALPALAQIARYGNVQGGDRDAVKAIFKSVAAKIIINLETTCFSLDDDAARTMQNQIFATGEALSLLNEAELLSEFRRVLVKMAEDKSTSALVAGRVSRMAFEARTIESDRASILMAYALSRASEKFYASLWLEGFLAGGAAVLIHDPGLLQLIDQWVSQLEANDFQEALPLLKRSFGQFSYSEKRQISESVSRLTGQDVTAFTSSTTLADGPSDEQLAPLIKTLRLLFDLPKEESAQ
ncbi:MAG: hypothetical protein IPP57_04040 [Candidatus Obscuribacter sp.]|nr:hypothetical protein [Candidatus Obscuribacter sp.]